MVEIERQKKKEIDCLGIFSVNAKETYAETEEEIVVARSGEEIIDNLFEEERKRLSFRMSEVMVEEAPSGSYTTTHSPERVAEFNERQEELLSELTRDVIRERFRIHEFMNVCDLVSGKRITSCYCDCH